MVIHQQSITGEMSTCHERRVGGVDAKQNRTILAFTPHTPFCLHWGRVNSHLLHPLLVELNLKAKFVKFPRMTSKNIQSQKVGTFLSAIINVPCELTFWDVKSGIVIVLFVRCPS